METVSGCRARPRNGISLLVGETGRRVRFAGIAAGDVAYVAATASGHSFVVVATRPLPAALGPGSHFFLQFQPQLSPAALANVHWTIVALDKHRRPLTSLRISA